MDILSFLFSCLPMWINWRNHSSIDFEQPYGNSCRRDMFLKSWFKYLIFQWVDSLRVNRACGLLIVSRMNEKEKQWVWHLMTDQKATALFSSDTVWPISENTWKSCLTRPFVWWNDRANVSNLTKITVNSFAKETFVIFHREDLLLWHSATSHVFQTGMSKIRF